MTRRRLPILVATLAACLLGTAATAFAGFDSLISASQSISTNTLLPPTSVTATLTSQCKSNKPQQITVTWTSSPSTFETGYTIQRDSTTITSVDATKTSYVDNTVAHATSYTYTVLATYDSWSSGQTGTPTTTC